MHLRTVQVTRYVTPLREGGSLPAIVEADDDGTYVLNFRGAGQGPRALIAELLAGEIARATGLPIPEIVFIQLDAELALTEPDPEIQDLIKASDGLNLALDYLPGSITFDPIVDEVDAALASNIVWFDAFVTNIDRTPRNANMLMWHKKLWLIDHGASLYFHHAWNNHLERSKDAFPGIKDHVLLPYATKLKETAGRMKEKLTPEVIQGIVDLIPESWMVGNTPFDGINEHRDAYIDYFSHRLDAHTFLEEAARAQAMSI